MLFVSQAALHLRLIFWLERRGNAAVGFQASCLAALQRGAWRATDKALWRRRTRRQGTP